MKNALDKNSVLGSVLLYLLCLSPLKTEAQVLLQGTQDTVILSASTVQEARSVLDASFPKLPKNNAKLTNQIQNSFINDFEKEAYNEVIKYVQSQQEHDSNDLEYHIERCDKQSGLFLFSEKSPVNNDIAYYVTSLRDAKEGNWFNIGMHMKITFSSCKVNGSHVVLFFNYDGGIENYVVEFSKKKGKKGEFSMYYKMPNSNLYINEENGIYSFDTQSLSFTFQKPGIFNHNALKSKSLDVHGLYVSWYFSKDALYLLDRYGNTYLMKPQGNLDSFGVKGIDILYIQSGYIYTNKGVFQFKNLSMSEENTLDFMPSSYPITTSFSIPNFGWIGIDSKHNCTIIYNETTIKVPIKISKDEKDIISQHFVVKNGILKISFPDSHVLTISLADGKILYNTGLNLNTGSFENTVTGKITNRDYFRSEDHFKSMLERVEAFENGNLDDSKKYVVIIASGGDWNGAFILHHEFGVILGNDNTLYFEVNSNDEFHELMNNENMGKVNPQLVIYAGHGGKLGYGGVAYSSFRNYKFTNVGALFDACSSAAGDNSGVDEWQAADGKYSIGLHKPARLNYLLDRDKKIIGVISGKGNLKLLKNNE